MGGRVDGRHWGHGPAQRQPARGSAPMLLPSAPLQHGVHYYFTTREQFAKEVEEGAFIEHAEVHGNLYGTSIAAVKTVLESGRVCILDIDVQGARSVRATLLKVGGAAGREGEGVACACVRARALISRPAAPPRPRPSSSLSRRPRWRTWPSA